MKSIIETINESIQSGMICEFNLKRAVKQKLTTLWSAMVDYIDANMRNDKDAKAIADVLKDRLKMPQLGEQDNEYAKDLVVYDINDAIVNYNDLDEDLFTKIAKAACPSIDPWDEN